MKPYEWMIRYTPQHEWIEKKGIFMPLAFYFGSLGGGLYLVSLYFNSLLGMVIAWLIVAVFKGGSHLIDLGRPFRSWRIIFRPQTSWISRGLILVILFLGFVPIQLFLFYFFPGTIWETVVKVLAGIAAFGTCVYPGFTLNYVNAIPLWNSAILPLVFIACGFLGGFALLLLIGMLGANVDLAMVEFGSMIFLIITALIILVFTSSVSYLGPPGKKALKDLLQGRASLVFWVGVVLVGIIMPFTIAFLGYVNVYDSKVILFFALVGEIVCGLSLTYVILRAGAYSPLIPNNTYED